MNKISNLIRTFGLRPKVLPLGKAKEKWLFLWLFARFFVPLHVQYKYNVYDETDQLECERATCL